MDVCFEGVRDSNGVILILGSRYGEPDQTGLSPTHQEFRLAVQLGKPVFAFVMQRTSYEPAQERFIQEVEKTVFRCAPVADADALASQVRRSIIAELARRWNVVQQLPPERLTPWEGGRATAVNVPPDPDDALQLLRSLYERGDDRSMAAVAHVVEGAFSSSPELLNIIYSAEVNIGMAMLPVNRDRVRRAISFWSSPSAAERWHPAGLAYNQGNAYSVLRERTDAISAYRRSLALKPDFAERWKNLGSEYHDSGDYEEARRCYEAALRHNSQLFEALYCLGTLQYAHFDKFEEARGLFDQIDLRQLSAGQAASTLAWKALTELERGNGADAVMLIDESLHLAAENEWLWPVAGRIYYNARRMHRSLTVRSLAFWHTFTQRYPANPAGWEELGLTLFRLRDRTSTAELTSRCRAALEAAVKLETDDGLAWDRLGHMREDAGEWEGALSCYERAASSDAAQHGECYARALMHFGRYSEALAYVEAAAREYQRDARAWTDLATCYEKLGRADEAEAAFRHAIQLDESYEYAWFNLGGFYWNTSRVSDAVKTWMEALSRFRSPRRRSRSRSYSALSDRGRQIKTNLRPANGSLVHLRAGTARHEATRRAACRDEREPRRERTASSVTPSHTLQ